MTAEALQDTYTLPDGLVLTGQLLSGKVQKGKTREDGEGHWPDRFIVTILTGDRTVQVEYKDEKTAKEYGAYAEALERVTIAVGVRAAKGYVFYFGRRA
jgi:hypothetical protein